MEQANIRLLERMLYFSDAVFAIVLTLLVLELRMPLCARTMVFEQARYR